MSEFFEPPPPQPRDSEARHRTPPWFGPPRGMLPGIAAVERVLARSEKAAVCVTSVSAYPTGFEVDLVTLTPIDEDELDPLQFGPPRRRGAGLPADVLRFGVLYADGRKATNLGADLPTDPTEPPSGPVMATHGGGGGGGRWHQTLWVWPLPPAGLLALVCEWPAAGIPLTRNEMDAGVIVDAGARAQAVFSDDTA